MHRFLLSSSLQYRRFYWGTCFARGRRLPGPLSDIYRDGFFDLLRTRLRLLRSLALEFELRQIRNETRSAVLEMPLPRGSRDTYDWAAMGYNLLPGIVVVWLDHESFSATRRGLVNVL